MMRIRLAVVVAALVAAVWWCGRALAIGWDSDDFIITGAPNFPQYIGVFDHDLSFKGYLDTNFLGVQGMDFDAQGRLVAVSSINPEVRVHNPDGTRAGGFTQAVSPMIVPTGDLKVAPDGSYVLGTTANGARSFTPQGNFIRQYGNGDSRGLSFVPGGRLWSGGNSTTVNVFDFGAGTQVGSFTLDQQINGSSMQYSAATNTVLVVDRDRDAGGVFERDLAGNLLHQFHVPEVSTDCVGAVRLPNGDTYATHQIYAPLYPDLVHWSADGTVLEERAIWPVQIKPGNIVWAGSVPEPETAAPLVVVIQAVFWRQSRSRISGRLR